MAFKNTILLVVISISFAACSSTGILDKAGEPIQNEALMEDDILVQNEAAYGLTVIGFKGNYDLLYDPLAQRSAGEVGQEYSYRYVINGSYFESSRVHAGWLSVFGVQYTPLKIDPQLSHMAILDTNLRYLDFPALDLWDPSMTNPKALEFQTGPLVIHENQVDTLSIQSSINGMSPRLRTLLAFTKEDGMFYFMITREVCRLDEIGDSLLSLDVFAGKTLEVMNLDGGSSTALYSKNQPGLNYNVNTRLPLFLGIR